MKNPQGNLKEFSFPRLLQAVYREGDAYGVLDILREPVKKRFFFKDGRPVFSTSNVLGEVLGRLLMEEGLITQSDYEASLEKVIGEKKKHGEVLVEMGLITNEKLEEFLNLQLKRRLLNIFGWNEGTYRYVATDSLPAEINIRPTHPGRLILEGISLGFYPPESIKSDLAWYLDKTLRLDGKTLKDCSFDDLGLNLQEQRFMAKFDGTRELAEILDQSDLLRHRALSIALAGIITGVVRPAGEGGAEEEEVAPETRLVDTSPETRMGAELMFMKARSAIIEGEYAKAADLLEQITELNPTEAEYWAYLGWAVFRSDPARADEAEKILKDSIDLNNDLDGAWYFLGRVFLEKGDEEWAERAFRTAVEKNPWMLEALTELKRLEISRTLARTASERREGERGRIEALGLATDPFGPVPEEEFHYPHNGGTAAAEELARWIRKRTGPVLLEGVEGAGKTTLLLDLLKRLSNDKVLAAVVLDPPPAELDLIKEVNAEVGASTDSASVKEQLLSLGMRLSQNKIQGGHSVVFIDNAHRLTDRSLKLIQYLSRLKTLQLVLLAEPSLTERLKDERFAELDGKLTGRTTLAPLDRGEVAAYIGHRLGAAGLREAVFGEDAVDEIFTKSSGVPGLVNRYAWETLATGKGLSTQGPASGAEEPAAEARDTWSFEEEETGPPAGGKPGEEEAVPGNVIDFGSIGGDRAPDSFDTADSPGTPSPPTDDGSWQLGVDEEGPEEEEKPFEVFGNEPVVETKEEETGGVTEGVPGADEGERGGQVGGETPEPIPFQAPAHTEEPPAEPRPAGRAYASGRAAQAARVEVSAPAEVPEEAAPEGSDDEAAGEPAHGPAGRGKKRSFAKVVLWLIIMLIAGLVIGSAIGVIIHGPMDLIDKAGFGGGTQATTPADR